MKLRRKVGGGGAVDHANIRGEMTQGFNGCLGRRARDLNNPQRHPSDHMVWRQGTPGETVALNGIERYQKRDV